MSGKGVTRTVIIVFVYYALYLAATIFESDFWGNILSPVGALLSASLLFYVYKRSKWTDFRRNIWLSFCLACLSWAAADLAWAVDTWTMSADPASDPVGLFCYFATSVFLAAGLVIFAIHTARKWPAVQLLTDIIAVSSACMLILWIFFFDKSIAGITVIYADGWYSAASLFIDLFIFIGTAVWYMSVRPWKLTLVMRLLLSAIVLYSLSDLVYYFLYFKNLYVPNSVIDALYMASLLGLAVGSILVPDTYIVPEPGKKLADKVGYILKSLILLPLPIMVFLYEGFDIPDLFVCGLLVISHNTVTHFIQTTNLNTRLLEREKELNAELEKKISERTSELIEKNRQLDYLSNQDTVTSLFNRRYFLQELALKVQESDKDKKISLAFLDLDRFKTINDTYGHVVGDHILIELAKRLLSLQTSDMMIARLGGDEFVIAFWEDMPIHIVENSLEEISSKCSEPIQVGEYIFQITTSIGLSVYPNDADSADALLRNADMAMYQAKNDGYNKIVVFSDILKQKNRWKNKLEICLKKADFNKEFMLYFQPQFSMPDKKLIGMEALLRWNCPGKGLIDPSEFIPLAEEIDWIIRIGDWVMTKAVKQIAQWNREYDLSLKMSINVSPKQLDQPGFANQIQAVMALEGIPSSWIDVEITEGVAMEGIFKINKISDEFKDSGISVSIDDFGTGYSSLSYLKMFPFRRVKIAKQLIDNITFDRYDLQIARSILLLTESIGVDCIAEGVETKEQFDLLNGLGLRQMQGFYLGRPCSAQEFEESFLKPIRKIDHNL
jgi:diguanylate cyclase